METEGNLHFFNCKIRIGVCANFWNKNFQNSYIFLIEKSLQIERLVILLKINIVVLFLSQFSNYNN